jgi:glutathione S-transferase
MNKPVLYSFRRCPYCMRAHMGLKNSGLKIELREVDLKAMPEELLTISARETVPVLVLSNKMADDSIIDESWDILKWALEQKDPDNWLGENKQFLPDAEMLVETNDFSFKNDLDHYKYADRFPEHSEEYYRQACEEFIEELEEMLSEHDYLLAGQLTIADVAVFPFVRQFSLVDKSWFDQSPYRNVQKWLQNLIDTELFQNVFQKRELWKKDANTVYI